MKSKHKFLSLLAFFVFLILPVTIHAQPSQFVRKAFSNGTSTPTFMTPGTATTTLAIDTAPGGYALDSLTLLVQQTASSTNSIANIDFEFADDISGIPCDTNQNACDWYSNDIFTQGTSSPSTLIQQTMSFNYASSSQGKLLGTINSTRSLTAISIASPTRYIRAIFTVPIGAKNTSVWAEFIGKKQIGER